MPIQLKCGVTLRLNMAVETVDGSAQGVLFFTSLIFRTSCVESVDFCMTRMADRDQVFFRVMPRLAAEFDVVNL